MDRLFVRVVSVADERLYLGARTWGDSSDSTATNET